MGVAKLQLNQRNQALSHSNTALHQLLNPISRHDFEKLAAVHHSGQKLRSTNRWDQFVGMLMSQLSGRQSLRDIQSNLEAQQHKLYHVGAKPITKPSLARLNDRQPAELYESLFYKLLHQLKRQPGKHKFRFKNPLYSMDASAIDLSLNLFPWAAYRDDTANVKLSVGLNHATEVPEFVSLSDGNENDMVEGRKFRFPKGSWLYLAVVIDLYSRRVVGWSMSSRMKADLVCDALKMAIWQRRPEPGLISLLLWVRATARNTSRFLRENFIVFILLAIWVFHNCRVV